MPIPVGSKAPDFTLKSKTATGLVDVKLSNNFGKTNTVVLFFPLAYTSVCTAEMCDVTNGLSAFPGANFIAISVDSPFTQEAWAKTNSIQVPLASDLNKTTTKAYDVLFPMLAGVGDTSARADPASGCSTRARSKRRRRSKASTPPCPPRRSSVCESFWHSNTASSVRKRRSATP